MHEVKPEEPPAVKAEKVKELGNVAFKAKRYGDAIDLYTQAIGVSFFKSLSNQL
jgi:DnaJ homolog subfamily C member 7